MLEDSTLTSTIPNNLLFSVQGLIKIFNFEIISQILRMMNGCKEHLHIPN